MADLRILQDVDTGEQFFPYTHEDAVVDKNGKSAIASIKSDLVKLEEGLNNVNNNLFIETNGEISNLYPSSDGTIYTVEGNETLIIDTENSVKTYYVISSNSFIRFAFANNVAEGQPHYGFTIKDGTGNFDIVSNVNYRYLMIFYKNRENDGSKPFVYVSTKLDEINSFQNIENFLTVESKYPSDLYPSLTNVAQTYYAYDKLVSAYPNYVTRKTIGTDQSATYSIYQYTFMPKCVDLKNVDTGKVIDYTTKPKHTIIIATGTHGNGEGGDNVDSIVAVYMFMKELCENYRNDRILNYIHHNVKIVVVPCRNPWGIDNNSRYNSRGVDLNRNFDCNWSKIDDTYGESAGSEAETVVMQNVLNTEKADFSVDVHTRGGDTFNSAEPQILYLGNLNTSTKDILQLGAGSCLANNEAITARIDLYSDSSRFYDYSESVADTPSCIVECYSWDIPLGSTTKRQGNTAKYNYESVANLIWSAINDTTN